MLALMFNFNFGRGFSFWTATNLSVCGLFVSIQNYPTQFIIGICEIAHVRTLFALAKCNDSLVYSDNPQNCFGQTLLTFVLFTHRFQRF